MSAQRLASAQAGSFLNALKGAAERFTNNLALKGSLHGDPSDIPEIKISPINEKNFMIAGIGKLTREQSEKLTKLLEKSLPGYDLKVQEGIVSIQPKGRNSLIQDPDSVWSSAGAQREPSS